MKVVKSDDELPRAEAPFRQLEQTLVEQYLRARGHDPRSLSELPERERQKLLTDAAIYASSKLAEIEARSRLIDELQEGAPGGTKASVA